MSAPSLTPRPVGPGRPTRPVQRTVPARAPRATTSRSADPRTGAARTGAPRSGASRTGASRADRSGPARAAGAARSVAASVVGATALALPAGLPATSPAPGGRTRMRVLERPRTGTRRVGFAVTCTAMLGALMLGLLLLNVAISGNAFTVAELQARRSLLVDQQQALEQQLLVNSAPSALAARARLLGMVPAPQVLVLAPDGTGAPPVAPSPAP